MYRLLMPLGLLVATLLTGPRAVAQPTEPVLNRSYQFRYAVPPHWAVCHQRTDSVNVLGYHNPADDARLWVGQLRGRHATLPPARALQRVLRHLGATRHEQHHAAVHLPDALESSGTYHLRGREVRYDARVSRHPGQVLLVHLYATPAAFGTQAPLLHHVLDGLAPLRGR
ncbi:hypothetical protein [Hymenobacter yonginensis]|uniref:PsbP C-terminal domain-containing protein n=1 Tax=Hymenobacter yonginensis TaxID=748197 RepID=A0ABY7PV27_9BACT|nr:hypothetical protein [Hymenobacter yonginensis]WBO86762.1 hypothetical protein O9Z63_20995 [Hymenobacter yonginensis]